MHYRNGREAHEGDFVIHNDGYKVKCGRVHSLSAQSTTCNGQMAVAVLGGSVQEYVTLSNCLHADDAWLVAYPEDGHPK